MVKTLMFPKPHKLTEKEKYEKKLLKLKEAKDRRIKRLLENKKKQVKKAKQPKLADLKRILQRKVNFYIRQRDAGRPCISCLKPVQGGNAGHYIAQGWSGALRFHPDNIHLQCVNCNHFKRGNLIEYRINLIKKIGEERVIYLEEHRHDIKKWTREELAEITIQYKQLLEVL